MTYRRRWKPEEVGSSVKVRVRDRVQTSNGEIKRGQVTRTRKIKVRDRGGWGVQSQREGEVDTN